MMLRVSSRFFYSNIRNNSCSSRFKSNTQLPLCINYNNVYNNINIKNVYEYRNYTTSTADNSNIQLNNNNNNNNNTNNNQKFHQEIIKREITPERIQNDIFKEIEGQVMASIDQSHLDLIPKFAESPLPWDEETCLALVSCSPFLSYVYPKSIYSSFSPPLVTLQNVWNSVMRKSRSKQIETIINNNTQLIELTNSKFCDLMKCLSNYDSSNTQHIQSLCTDYYFLKSIKPTLDILTKSQQLSNPARFTLQINQIDATRTKLQQFGSNLFISIHYRLNGSFGVNDYQENRNYKLISSAIWHASIPESAEGNTNSIDDLSKLNWKVAFLCPSTTGLMAMEQMVPPLQIISSIPKASEQSTSESSDQSQ